MVYITEIPWHEMNVNDELTLQTGTEAEFIRKCEWSLRETIYLWEHMPADMAVEPVIHCPLIINDPEFGIETDRETVSVDGRNPVTSSHFIPVIKEEADIAKIKDPNVTYDKEQTERNYEVLQEIFKGILEVKKQGRQGMWFSPWDRLVTWYGVQEALMDLIARPEFVHKVMERLMEVYLARLKQYEDLGLFSSNNTNGRVGSGGYGYTDELPAPVKDHGYEAKELWGCATAQIFSEVSPRMHEEFALNYEKRWLEKFGLTYYGCCEPLHRKIGILSKIPNLRKISMSPWIKIDEAAAQMGDKYVFSLKPNPAVFMTGSWEPREIRKNLTETLEKTRGCRVEVILKDISSTGYKPRHLWEWARIASEVAEKFA